jgi:hypothetical protein
MERPPAPKGSVPRRRLLAGAVAGLASASCGHSAFGPFSRWGAVKTRHITLYTDTAFLHATTLESLELAYSILVSTLLPRDISPVEVLFLETTEMVSAFGQYRKGVTVARLPGHGAIGARGLVVVGQETRIPTAAHQLAHLLLHAMAPKAPLWVHEAYAEFLESASYRTGGGRQEAVVGFLGGSGPTIPLEDLFSWTWLEYDRSAKAQWYRFTARCLLDFFFMSSQGALRPRFDQVMRRLARGADTRATLAEIFPELPLPQLEEKMREFRKDAEMRPRGLSPFVRPVIGDRAADLGKPQVDRVSKEEIERLFHCLWMLPRRDGYVDWYPPEVVSLAPPPPGGGR